MWSTSVPGRPQMVQVPWSLRIMVWRSWSQFGGSSLRRVDCRVQLLLAMFSPCFSWFSTVVMVQHVVPGVVVGHYMLGCLVVVFLVEVFHCLVCPGERLLPGRKHHPRDASGSVADFCEP